MFSYLRPNYPIPVYNKEPFPVEDCIITLLNNDLWNKFFELQTEMIITKSGRRMFPAISVRFQNLDPNASYCVFVEMSLHSQCRYKYSSAGGWSPAGNEEVQSPHHMYMHPESPAKGEHWMSQPVNFNRLKLTNTATPPPGHLVLSSMHKYQPRIIIAKTSSPAALNMAPSKMALFPQTQFIAVTAYQNDKITKLKIDNNPFAKGFRENGKSSSKRKHVNDETEETLPSSPESNSETSQMSLPSPVQNAYIPVYQNYVPPVPYFVPYWTYPPYFVQPPPFYSPLVQNEPENLSTRPNRITDFSIDAIIS